MVELHSKQEAVEIVKKWLQEEQYEISLVPDESTDYNFLIVKGVYGLKCWIS